MYLVYRIESCISHLRPYGPIAGHTFIPIAFFTTREKLDKFLKEIKKHKVDRFKCLRIQPAIIDRKEITSTMKRKIGWRKKTKYVY